MAAILIFSTWCALVCCSCLAFPVQRKQILMAAILIFSTWCVLVIYRCVTSPNKYWCPPSWLSARGCVLVNCSCVTSLTITDARHLDFQHVVHSGELQLYFLSKQILITAILIFSMWCALVIYSCVTSPYNYWWPPSWLSARGALWWSTVVLPLHTITDGRHLDFQHVVRSGDLQLCYLS